MKITDMIVSALLRKGIFCDARNVDVTFNIPSDTLPINGSDIYLKASVNVRIDHLTVKLDKGADNA